jgi:cytochrome c oxidase assembly factor 6
MNPGSRAVREKCYVGRDAYFACLDQGKGAEECKQLRDVYESVCLPSWVKHFEQSRNYERQKRERIRMIEQQDAQMRKGK